MSSAMPAELYLPCCAQQAPPPARPDKLLIGDMEQVGRGSRITFVAPSVLQETPSTWERQPSAACPHAHAHPHARPHAQPHPTSSLPHPIPSHCYPMPISISTLSHPHPMPIPIPIPNPSHAMPCPYPPLFPSPSPSPAEQEKPREAREDTSSSAGSEVTSWPLIPPACGMWVSGEARPPATSLPLVSLERRF